MRASQLFPAPPNSNRPADAEASDVGRSGSGKTPAPFDDMMSAAMTRRAEERRRDHHLSARDRGQNIPKVERRQKDPDNRADRIRDDDDSASVDRTPNSEDNRLRARDLSTIDNARAVAAALAPAVIPTAPVQVAAAATQTGSSMEESDAVPAPGSVLVPPTAGAVEAAKTGAKADAKAADGPAPPATPGGSPVSPQAGGEKGESPPQKDSETVAHETPASKSKAGPDISGISAAQQALQMKKAVEMNNSTGLTEQNLPVNAAPMAGQNLPVHEKRSFTAPANQPDASALSAASARVPGLGDPVLVEAAAAVRGKEPSLLIERASELITQNAVHLRDVATDSLRVVIKPGMGTELSLNLQQRDGMVEVQATLQRGDFDLLNRHWSELQQQLEARGVRLAPLTAEANLANGNNPFEQKRSASGDEDKRPATGPLGFTTALAAPEVKARPAAAPRGWESWA